MLLWPPVPVALFPPKNDYSYSHSQDDLGVRLDIPSPLLFRLISPFSINGALKKPFGSNTYQWKRFSQTKHHKFVLVPEEKQWLPFTQSAPCCISMHPKPSLAQLCPTLPFPTLSYPPIPYPNLPYSTPTPPNPWVVHSPLSQRMSFFYVFRGGGFGRPYLFSF